MDPVSTDSSVFLSGLLPDNPHYGYLIAAVILFVWLIGIIRGWEWTYSRPGSYRGNFLLNLLGPKTYRFFLGALLVLMLLLVFCLFFTTGR